MNIAVIGLGSMGKRRIRIMKEMKLNSIIIGIDNNEERCNFVKDSFNVECFPSLESAEEAVNIDCAFICTSPLSHADLIAACLSHGYHVFTEINLVKDKYEENIELAKSKGVVLFLSSTPLYKSEMQIIGKRLSQNGKSCLYQYHVGQYLPDWHPWDRLSDFFVSSKSTNGCRELFAIELPWLQMVFGRVKKFSVIKKQMLDLGLDFPDTYLLQLEHENGNVGSLIIDVVSRQAVRRLEIMNEDIYIRWDGTPETLYEKNIQTGLMEQIGAGKYEHEQEYASVINEYAYLKEIEEFFAVINGKKPIYDFEMDMETLKIIDEIEREGAV